MTDNTQFCYSWDDELFNSGTFDSVKSALADAVAESDDGDEGQKTHVYVGEVEPWHNHDFYPSASVVLEHMQEQAWGEAGEHADDYAEVSVEARDELSEKLTSLLDEWCAKHAVSPRFYRVKNVSLHPLPVNLKDTVK